MSKAEPKTWKELKAQGVQRCCATFTGGRQCRRRAVANGFCRKHQWVHKTAHDLNKAALDSLALDDEEDK
jgi:hypothetical protein